MAKQGVLYIEQGVHIGNIAGVHKGGGGCMYFCAGYAHPHRDKARERERGRGRQREVSYRYFCFTFVLATAKRTTM